MRRWIAFALLLVCACATTRQYEQNLKQWEGQPSESLFKKWGSPDSSTTLADGGKVYLFIKPNKEKIKIRKEGDPKKAVPLYDCKTTFLTDPQEVVVGWKYEGHGCRAD